MPKILRITTVPISLNLLLKGQLSYMQQHGFEVITASADGPEVREVIERENVMHFVIPFTRIISPWQDLKCLFKLIKLIKKEKPHIVHTHTPKAGLIGMMASKLARVPYRLHTVAGMPLMEAQGFIHRILRATEKITYACATHIYPNSINLKNWIGMNFKSDLSKLKVIGAGSSNGINTKYFESNSEIDEKALTLRNQLKINPKALVFCFVGRLVSDKGINELVKSFVILQKRLNRDIHLLLVGEYEDQREPVSVLIKEEIIKNNSIHSVGFQKDVRPYLAASDVFVFPSYREGFPNVVLQACAMNLPCVVTDINGSNEIITDHINGLIVPVKNVNKLSSAMQELVLEDDLRDKLKSNARKSILPYDQNEIWQTLLSEYKNLLN